MTALLLASTSPRRRALLEATAIPFALCEPGDEPAASGPPEELARQRALAKARGARAPADALLPAGARVPVLAVDTVVDLDGRELGKAADRDEAERMLQALAGKVHRVHTAHVLREPWSGREAMELATAEVACRVPAGEELAAYLDGGEWRGKAGAYGIQDATQSFLTLRTGAFDTVVGLHVPAVRRLLALFAGR